MHWICLAPYSPLSYHMDKPWIPIYITIQCSLYTPLTILDVPWMNSGSCSFGRCPVLPVRCSSLTCSGDGYFVIFLGFHLTSPPATFTTDALFCAHIQAFNFTAWEDVDPAVSVWLPWCIKSKCTSPSSALRNSTLGFEKLLSRFKVGTLIHRGEQKEIQSPLLKCCCSGCP